MSKWPMRGHFRYLRFNTYPITSRTHQCELFWALLSSSEHSGVPEDSKFPTFPSVGLHPHTWPKWGCDTAPVANQREYYKGEGGGFPKSEPWWILWILWVRAQKCSNHTLTNLLFGLWRFVWIIDQLITSFSLPYHWWKSIIIHSFVS
jgi:hypothetical protein